jgi:hypothetical protein
MLIRVTLRNSAGILDYRIAEGEDGVEENISGEWLAAAAVELIHEAGSLNIGDTITIEEIVE